jgi:hypothetical protein
MEIEKIKKRNPKHYQNGNLSQSMDDDTYGEIYESDVRMKRAHENARKTPTTFVTKKY